MMVVMKMMMISYKAGIQVLFLYFLEYSFEHQIKLYMQAYIYLCLLVVSKRDALFLGYAENVFVV